jgi:hypothetical protein
MKSKKRQDMVEGLDTLNAEALRTLFTDTIFLLAR